MMRIKNNNPRKPQAKQTNVQVHSNHLKSDVLKTVFEKFSSYLKENITRHHYKNKFVNVVGKNQHSLCELYET
jgi:bisphosphoglycerate-dependent phosphoglycerate mutase